jgi:hypothetical protein
MSIPVGKKIKIGTVYFVLIAIVGVTYYWKNQSTNAVVECTCHFNGAGVPVTWTPSANASFCNTAWITSGQNPNQCQ